MTARMRIGALLLGPVCLFGAAEAPAAPVCSNTPGANDRIVCLESGANDIDIDLTNPAIATSGATEHGVDARHTITGTGKIDIEVTGGSISATGGMGFRIQQQGTGGASVVLKGGVEVMGANRGVYGEVANTANTATLSIDVAGGSVSTTGGAGVFARSSGTGGIDVDLAGVIVSTGGVGVDAWHTGAGRTGVDIDITRGSISTTGRNAHGVYGDVRTDSGGTASIDLTDVAVSTKGGLASGVHGLVRNAAGKAVSISVTRGSVSTEGLAAHAIFGYVSESASTAPISIKTTGVEITATGPNTYGVYAIQDGAGALDVDLRGGSISTAGTYGYGVFIWNRGGGGFDIDLEDVDITSTTVETRSRGVVGYSNKAGKAALSIDVTRGDIVIAGATSYGLYGLSTHAESEATISIVRTGGAIVTPGLGARGIFGYHLGLGSAAVRTRAAEIEAPFAVGIEGRLTNDANAAGRILLTTHEGAIKAREAGVLAWAARSSGHTGGRNRRTM